MHQLWIVKHRPRNLEQYVWRDQEMRRLIEGWIEQKALPHVLFSGHHGCGKAQPLDAKVLTPVGWQLMGDLAIGDSVMTPSGRVAAITGIFPQGEKEVFRVIFDDDKSVECCQEHLWEVCHSDWLTKRVLSLDAIEGELKKLSQ